MGLEIGDGTAQIMKHIIAREMLSRARERSNKTGRAKPNGLGRIRS